MASQQDQLLASRQEGWKGFSRFLLWGTIDAAVITLIAALFYINGPSFGLAIVAFILVVVVMAINAIAVVRS